MVGPATVPPTWPVVLGLVGSPALLIAALVMTHTRALDWLRCRGAHLGAASVFLHCWWWQW
jgi:hypothetical protein